MNIIQTALDVYNDGKTFLKPWPFTIADNFLNFYTYDNIINKIEEVDYEVLDGSDKTNAWKRVHRFSDDDLNNQLYFLFSKHIGLECKQNKIITEIVRCDPGYYYPIHIDHCDKLFSVVVYLSPSTGNGTVLTDKRKPNLDDLGYEIIWRQNRALIFEYNEHAFHFYQNTSNQLRYTLNINLVKEYARFVTVKH